MTVKNTAALIDVEANTFALSDPSQLLLSLDDLAAHRGDGIFETVLVTYRDDATYIHNQALHFQRFIESARMLELPSPDPKLWEEALHATAKQYKELNPDAHTVSIRYTLSRGHDSDTTAHTPHGWVFTAPVPLPEPTEITVITLNSGLDSSIAESAPWLLRGAKTLSYATNQAAKRYALSNGADDALFHTSDGYVLEGPNSTLILRIGDQLITPDPKIGILHGTTQRCIFENASGQGLLTQYANVTMDDLGNAQGAWLVSSIRGCRPISTLLSSTSGTATHIPVDHDLTEHMLQWVLSS
ncbi:aminotransferase class IV [Brevibacterium sp. UMB10442]|nr:aminotransferase class IV [Brevibacterium sp. UMB10442]